jgi:RimJ/RimL family protein N-acetyltransferase
VTVLHTARLALRPVDSSDHARLHEMFRQPGVRRFIFDDELIPDEQTASIIERSAALFAAHGYGLWLASDDPELIGFGAFWHFRDTADLELLYGVMDRHVKKGYGREIVRALVAYGDATLGWDVIRASTDPAHDASRRLLEELGFRLTRREVVAGLDTVFYERRRGESGPAVR